MPGGNKSAGKVIASVENERWAKNAMLNRAISARTGTCVTRHVQGITAAQAPSTALREKLSEYPLSNKRLEHQRPTTLPTPDAA